MSGSRDFEADQLEAEEPFSEGTVITTAEWGGPKTGRLSTDELARVKPQAYLVMLLGPGAGQMFPLEQADVVLGRGSEADIRVGDVSVSRAHAQLRMSDEQGVELEDLGSSNGTLVNGARVRRAQLNFGDKIQIGDNTVLLLTQRDRVEEQLQQAQKMESIGRLAGGVAHDINNVLGTLLFSINYLEAAAGRGPIDELDLMTRLSEQKAAVKRASELTGRVLSFARPSVVERSSVRLGEVLGDVIKLARRTFDRAIAIEAEIEDNLSVIADASELHQVFMNLCLNARDAMPTGGTLTITGRLKQIHGGKAPLPLLSAGSYVVIDVEDSGVGMEDSTRRQIFEPFFTTKPTGQGTGIGLSTVYAIVTNLGGQIQVDSERGKGTQFRLYLPATATAEAESNDSVGDTQPIPWHETAKGTILLVDDDELVRRSTQRLLEAEGYGVVCCRDGSEAVEVFREKGESFQLVLLDMIMPKLGGVETMDALRGCDPNVRIVMMSGYSDSNQLEALSARHPEAFLRKPCDANALFATIARVIGEQPTA